MSTTEYPNPNIHVVKTLVDDRLKAELERVALKTDRSVAWLVRQMIRDGLRDYRQDAA